MSEYVLTSVGEGREGEVELHEDDVELMEYALKFYDVFMGEGQRKRVERLIAALKGVRPQRVEV
jgi:hypothetical protein